MHFHKEDMNVFTSRYLALLLSQLGKTLMQDNGNKLYANHYFSPGMWLARLHPSISGHVLAVFRQFFCAEAENKQSPARNIWMSQSSALEHTLLWSPNIHGLI